MTKRLRRTCQSQIDFWSSPSDRRSLARHTLRRLISEVALNLGTVRELELNHAAQRAYDRSPRIVQTGALNLFGVSQRRRFEVADRVAASLRVTEGWNTERQMAYVSDQLRAILVHALEHVARYRSLRLLIRDLEDPAADVFALLQEFPIVSRADVARRPTDFLSDAFARRSLKANTTSGTTGSPLQVWVEPAVERVNDGLIRRRDVWAGYRRGDWVARLVGDPVVPLRTESIELPYRISWTDRRLYLSTYHLSRETAKQFSSLLEERRPEFLQGYPSALEALACWGASRVGNWSPKAVLFSSEPLHEHQKNAIEAFSSAPLRGFYGCAERVVSAAQCASGTYHLSLVDGYVEGEFEGVAGGQSLSTGEAPMTTLVNRAMPLIRYRLGDAISFAHGELCSCGRTLPVMSPVVTKAEDAIVTPTGRLVSPSILTWAFKDVPGLLRSQVIQRSGARVEVLVVVTPDFSRDIEGLLAERLRSMVFGEMTITVTRVLDIPMKSGGKTRFVVNEHKLP